jgi:hypothetical protein
MEKINRTQENTLVRVSAASLARIELDGKILVGLNKKRLQAGKKIYTPFGGALEFYEPARPILEGLGAKFEKGMDLRFVFPESNLPMFEKWFDTRNDRETSPYRELREELVDEERALPDLPENVLSLEYITTVTERAVSDRPGQEGIETQRYLEIYKASFNECYSNVLRHTLQDPNTHLALVSEDEIRAEVTNSGIKIATNCGGLIHGR